MANNRLYIQDPENNEQFMLAKSMGDGWQIRDEEYLGALLSKWLELRDMEASYGNVHEVKTKLILICENDPEYRRMDKNKSEE